MSENNIVLSINEDTTIQLPNRGAMGLRIVYHVADPAIASITRKEIKSEDLNKLNIRPGDAIPAYFIIKGLQKGTTVVNFSERKPGVNAGDDLPLQQWTVQVDE